MRVIAGLRKGHPLKAVPGSSTRPTTDKVKEALFSMIGPYFDGGIALDLFAGTGGLGIEALSRGVEKAILVDRDAKSIQTIKENVEKTKFQTEVEVIRGDALKCLDQFAARGLSFELIFIDPPYQGGFYRPCLQRLRESSMISESTRIIVESDPSNRDMDEILLGWQRLKHAEYGSICIDVIALPMTEGE